jgi:hypothetical protein
MADLHSFGFFTRIACKQPVSLCLLPLHACSHLADVIFYLQRRSRWTYEQSRIWLSLLLANPSRVRADARRDDAPDPPRVRFPQ